VDPQEFRAEQLAGWERAAAGWAKQAPRLRDISAPVSEWMVEHLALEAGQTVLELAAGPGDTGFSAARRVAPGRLISSDATEAMLELARRRAQEQGIENVEFRRLQLEWIDLPTASIDAVLCRWGLMLLIDPGAAAGEIRRVLRPGGRVALAVWDEAERNPWATIPGRALVELGHAEPPDPGQPGMFTLAAPGKLRGLLESAGFLDVVVEGVAVDRVYPGTEAFLAETRDFSRIFADAWKRLTEAERAELTETIARKLGSFQQEDGSLLIPGHTLVAAARA
jgi:SAM-dependent methyltransferase